MVSALRRLALWALAFVLSIGLSACDGGNTKAAPTISAEDMATIGRQAQGFLEAKERLPELATLVNEKNWVFTRNLIHGPM
jgi:photosystem II protein PsbQ